MSRRPRFVRGREGNPAIKRAAGHSARWREGKGDRKTCGNKGRQDRVKTPTLSHSFAPNTFNWTTVLHFLYYYVISVDERGKYGFFWQKSSWMCRESLWNMKTWNIWEEIKSHMLIGRKQKHSLMGKGGGYYGFSETWRWNSVFAH